MCVGWCGGGGVILQSSFEQVLTAAGGITKNHKRADSLCLGFFMLIWKVSTVLYALCNHFVLALEGKQNLALVPSSLAFLGSLRGI